MASNNIIKPSVTSRDLLARKLVSNNIYDRMDEIEARFNDYIRSEITADTTEEISGGDLGLIQIGETRYGNGVDPGSGWTGIRMVYPGVDYDGDTYLFATAIADVLRVGITEDGVLIGGSGAVSIDETGIVANAGAIGGFTLDANQLYTDGGSFFISAINMAIGLGATDYLTGTGFWVGKNSGVYKMHLGNPAGEYLKWDGTNLSITGGITASWGNIAGWIIGATTLSKNNAILSSDGYLLLGTGNDIVQLSSTDATYRIWVGDATASDAPFKVTKAGDVIANNITANGAIRSAVFVYGEMTATAGSLGIFKSSGKLLTDLDVSVTPTTIDIEDTNGHVQLFEVNDILRVKFGAIDTWYKVTAVSDQVTYYQYTVARQSGSVVGTLEKGIAVSDYGQAGNGFLILTADDEGAPYFSVRTHNGDPWTSQTERVRLGNLIGVMGKTAAAYGLMVGNDLSDLSNYSGTLLAEPAINLPTSRSPAANIAGFNNGVPMFWLSADDGSAGFAGGRGQINDQGILMLGTNYFVTMTAGTSDDWVSGNQRVSAIGMILPSGGTVPEFKINYYDPVAPGNTELVLTDMNGDFEDGDLSYWTASGGGTWTAGTAIKYAGSYAGQLTILSISEGGSYGGILLSDPIEVTAGKDYVTSFYYRSSDAGISFFLTVLWYSDEAGTTEISHANYSGKSTTTFTKYQMTNKAPAGAIRARIRLLGFATTFTCYHYFDNVSFLEMGTPSSAMALKDGTMEVTGSITATGNIAASRIKGTKALGARVIRTSTQSLSAATWTELSWDRETDTCDHSGNQSDDTSDSDNIWTSGNPTRLYCREDGWYTAGGGYEVQANSSAIMRRGIQVKLYNSGGTLHGILARNQTMDASGSSAYLSIAIQTGHFYMHSGDYITVEAETGAARTIQAATTTEHYHNFGFLTRVS